MKAVRVHEYHSEPRIDDIPEPTLQGPLDVIVKIGGAGVCRTDLHIVNGDWAQGMNPDLPYVIGHENAGWVHEIGEGVTNVAVGDTVILHHQPSCGLCLGLPHRQRHALRERLLPGLSNNDGGMAEYLRTTARACVKLNPETNPADVAALADAGSAYHAVRKAVPRLWPGTTAVVQGAGGLGTSGSRRSRRLRDPHRRGRPEPGRTRAGQGDRRGRDGGIRRHPHRRGQGPDRRSGRRRRLRLRRRAGRENDAWAMTAPDGFQYVIGYGGEFRAPTLDFVAGEKSIIGNIVGTYNDLAELMVLAQAGKVTLHTKQYPLDAALDALHDLDAGRVRGRAILVP